MDIANRLPAALPASALPASHRAHAPASESRTGSVATQASNIVAAGVTHRSMTASSATTIGAPGAPHRNVSASPASNIAAEAKPAPAAAVPGTAPRTTPPADTTRADLDRYASLGKTRHSHGTTQSASAGYQTLVERLYEGREPPVRTFHADGVDHHRYHYLNRADRSFLGEVYAFAQTEGVDPRHVDALADVLADYRYHDDGKMLHSFNTSSYDGDGRKLTVDFNERDAAAAQRIRNGSAIHSTRVDRGFLHYLTDPGKSALGNLSDLSFVEKIVLRPVLP